MDVRHAATIDAPLAEAWPLLRDVRTVAECLPGAELREVEDGTECLGTLTVALGPTRVRFSGRASFVVSDDDNEIAIEASGADQRGRTKASAHVTVSAKAESSGLTHLEVVGNIEVVGALSRFAQTGGAHLAGQLLRDFSGCLTRRVESRGEVQESRQSEELHPARLTFRALLAWFKQLFRRQ